MASVGAGATQSMTIDQDILQDQLAQHLASAQSALASSHEHALSLVSQWLENVRQINIENRVLRSQLSAMGGVMPPENRAASHPRPPDQDTLPRLPAITPASKDELLSLKANELSAFPEKVEMMPVVPVVPSSYPGSARPPTPLEPPPALGGADGGCDSEEDEEMMRANVVPGLVGEREGEPRPGSSLGILKTLSQTSQQGAESTNVRSQGLRFEERNGDDSDEENEEEDFFDTGMEGDSDEDGPYTYPSGLPRTCSEDRTSSRGKSAKSSENKKKFILLEQWQSEEVQDRAKVATSTHQRNKSLIKAFTRPMKSILSQDSRLQDLLEPAEKKKVGQCVVHPCGLKRACWDVSSLTLVIYDMIVLPLQFFDPPEYQLQLVMTWVTRLFWSADMPLSMMTGFLLSDGSIELRPCTICLHYLRTWFVLDILLVSVDWVEVVIGLLGGASDSGAASDLGRLGKASRTFRTLRMLRLLRMARMGQILKLFTFRMQSERLVILTDISKILSGILATAHLMACFWYAVGKQSHDDGKRAWITEERVGQMSLGGRYMVSLHWSLSQFTGGMDEFRARNINERLFNVIVFLIAFMMASVCVSGLTSSMTRLHILASHQSRQLSVLRRYLIQNGISDRLALRVQRNALHAISEQQRLMAESNVELLATVSEPLRVELHFEMYSPVLEVHPFFTRYITECPQVMCKVCHQAMSTLLVSYGDVIFNAGEIPEHPKMYVVCNGSCEYVGYHGDIENLHSEQWVSEASLWTLWMHRGALKATSDGRLCVLLAKKFVQIVCQFDHPDFEPRVYAYEYVNHLNSVEDVSEINDLPLGFESKFLEPGACEGSAKPLALIPMKKDLNLFGAKRNMMDTPSSSAQMAKKRQSVLMAPSGGLVKKL